MRRRHLLQGSATALLPASAHASTIHARPNIVYIHSHDSGRYLSPYKSGVPAPAIARLAQQGVLFHQVFSGAPVCSPSRAAMLTGQPAHRSGMNGLAHRGFSLNDPQQLIFRYLQRYGYGQSIPLIHPGDRIGSSTLTIDPDRLAAVVITDEPDRNAAFAEPDTTARQIAGHVMDLFEHEVKQGRLPPLSCRYRAVSGTLPMLCWRG